MKMNTIRSGLIGLVGAAIFLTVVIFMNDEFQSRDSGALFFTSPEDAIPIITGLLEKEDFGTLAKYYDLSGSDIEFPSLESGDFFIRKKRPEVSHPSGFWRYKHPFPPGFEFSSIRKSTREGVYVIHVEIEIDQGAESPIQVAQGNFQMINIPGGWKILPDQINTEEPLEKPSEAPDTMPDPPWEKSDL